MKILSHSSTVSLHFEKHQRKNMTGLQRHVERVQGQKHSNENIDDSLTSENIFLIDNRKNGTYTERFDKAIEKHFTSKRKVRKDAVTMISTTVNLGGTITELDRDKQVEVLTKVAEHLKAKKSQFDDDNILSAVIHVDENTPHLHFDFIPLTSDGRLSAKEIMSKSNLRIDQDELLEFLQEEFPTYNFNRQKEEDKLLKNGSSLAEYVAANEKYNELLNDLKDYELELIDDTEKLEEQKRLLQIKEQQLNDKESKLNSKADELANFDIELKKQEDYLKNEKIEIMQNKAVLERSAEQLTKDKAEHEKQKRDESERLKQADKLIREKQEHQQLQAIELQHKEQELTEKEESIQNEMTKLERLKESIEQMKIDFIETKNKIVDDLKDIFNRAKNKSIIRRRQVSNDLNRRILENEDYQPFSEHVEDIKEELHTLKETDFSDLYNDDDMTL